MLMAHGTTNVTNYIMVFYVAPVAAFFEAESVNSAWINAHIRMIVRWQKDIIRAESCYHGDIRLFNISFIKVRILGRGWHESFNNYAV